MDIDLEIGVKHTWSHERPYKVTLTRGARGVYRWEIEVRDSNPDLAVEVVEGMDDRLRERYAALEPTGVPEGS